MDEKRNSSSFYWRNRPATDAQLTWTEVSRYDRKAVVVGTEWLTTTGTVRIAFQIIDDHPFDFSAGQWLALEDEVPGVGPRRSPYCIYSPPSDDGRFDLLIRVLPDGPLSQHLASLEIGYPINFRGPRGRPILPKAHDENLVMLATGVGIAPLYSLLGYLMRVGETRPVRLYWGLRLTDDICLIDELDELVAGLADFSYAISLSQPPPDWAQLRGRLTETVPALVPKLGGTRFYLCGNGAMVEEIEMAIVSLGVDRTSIFEEKFFNLKHLPERSTMEAIRARFVADDLTTANSRLRTQVWRASARE